jgi:hypothetical protein
MCKYLMSVLLLILLVGCSGAKGEEFVISGKITAIDTEKKYIYVDKQGPIKYNEYSKLKISQQVKFVLQSTDSDDVWDPEKIKVKSVETP